MAAFTNYLRFPVLKAFLVLSDESQIPQIFSLYVSDPYKQTPKLASAAQGGVSKTALRNV